MQHRHGELKVNYKKCLRMIRLGMYMFGRVVLSVT